MTMNCAAVRELAPGFVLGALDRAEMAAVREHLATCDQPHPEVRELGGVVSYIGDTLVPIEPSAGLRASVIAAARGDVEARKAAPASNGVPKLTVVPSAPRSRVVPFAAIRNPLPRRAATWMARIAAAVVIVALTGTAITFLNSPNTPYSGPRDPISRWVVLTPSNGNIGGGLAAFMASGNLHVSVYGLTPTTGDQAYMVWVSVDGSNAKAAGWFTGDSIRDVEVDGLSPSSSLWVYVCREPNSKVTKPTGPIVVSGTIYLWAPTSTPTL